MEGKGGTRKGKCPQTGGRFSRRVETSVVGGGCPTPKEKKKKKKKKKTKA